MKYMIVELDGTQQIKRFNHSNYRKYRSLGYNIYDIELTLQEAKEKVLNKNN